MIRKIFFPHLAAAIIVSGLILLIYAGIQQTYRTSADDPQLQIARDIANRVIQNKQQPAALTGDSVDLERSLNQFVQWYDGNGHLLQSTGHIGSSTPTIPSGVFASAKSNGEDNITWQPTRNARIAAVVVYTGESHPGYVLAGRSLFEIEKRESNLLTMCILCWVACMGVILAHGLLQGYMLRRETV